MPIIREKRVDGKKKTSQDSGDRGHRSKARSVAPPQGRNSVGLLREKLDDPLHGFAVLGIFSGHD